MATNPFDPAPRTVEVLFPLTTIFSR